MTSHTLHPVFHDNQKDNVISINFANDGRDLDQILVLQRASHKANLSRQEAIDQGFVSVLHTRHALKSMNQKYKHIVAKENEIVVGYALCMLKEFSSIVPDLAPMFEEVDQSFFKAVDMSNASYMAMGQICISKSHRGTGLFYKLYEKLKMQMGTHFDFCVTEIATRNLRSYKAHKKLGFELVKKHHTPDGEEWNLVVWDWRK